MPRRRRRLSTVALVVLGLTVLHPACGGGPAAPSTDPVDLTATWSGPASDSSGLGEVTWRITQSGTAFSGTLLLTDAETGVSGRGAVSGTIAGSSIDFLMTVPAGGFEGPYTSCAASVSGNARAASSSITGTYSGSNSCSGAIGSGQLKLDKR